MGPGPPGDGTPSVARARTQHGHPAEEAAARAASICATCASTMRIVGTALPGDWSLRSVTR
eukprot:1989397-Pyramimonas_sp.AAC.1